MSCQIHQQLYQSLIINIRKPPQSPHFQTCNKVTFHRVQKSDLYPASYPGLEPCLVRVFNRLFSASGIKSRSRVQVLKLDSPEPVSIHDSQNLLGRTAGVLCRWPRKKKLSGPVQHINNDCFAYRPAETSVSHGYTMNYAL